MEGRADLDSFLDKWRRRWPEWRVAEAFVPASRRDACCAWLALRQEFADAAWAGADPRPGEAKLGWWVEELLGWEQGHARHPLGRVLQPIPAPWAALAATLPALVEARERASDFGEARQPLQAHANAVAAVSRALEGAGGVAGADTGADTGAAIADGLLAQRLLDGDPAAIPLQARAMLGAQAPDARLRAEASAMLLRGWQGDGGMARADRLHLALLRARLRSLAAGGQDRPLSPWRVLATAWRAARS